MLIVFLISILYYAYSILKIIESCHSYDLITALERPSRIHYSTNSETTIQWFSFKYNPALKLNPQCKSMYKIQAVGCKHNGTL